MPSRFKLRRRRSDLLAVMIDLRFRSDLAASVATVWREATTIGGIGKEMRPLLHMTAPRGKHDLRSLSSISEESLFRSRLLAFGFLPIGHSDLTIAQIEENFEAGRAGFVENSDMTGMRFWRHIRTLRGDAGTCRIEDHIECEPVAPAAFVRPILALFFRHRHRRLRSVHGVAA